MEKKYGSPTAIHWRLIYSLNLVNDIDFYVANFLGVRERESERDRKKTNGL